MCFLLFLFINAFVLTVKWKYETIWKAIHYALAPTHFKCMIIYHVLTFTKTLGLHYYNLICKHHVGCHRRWMWRELSARSRDILVCNTQGTSTSLKMIYPISVITLNVWIRNPQGLFCICTEICLLLPQITFVLYL